MFIAYTYVVLTVNRKDNVNLYIHTVSYLNALSFLLNTMKSSLKIQPEGDFLQSCPIRGVAVQFGDLIRKIILYHKYSQRNTYLYYLSQLFPTNFLYLLYPAVDAILELIEEGRVFHFVTKIGNARFAPFICRPKHSEKIIMFYSNSCHNQTLILFYSKQQTSGKIDCLNNLIGYFFTSAIPVTNTTLPKIRLQLQPWVTAISF